jgi:hypothetical protein
MRHVLEQKMNGHEVLGIWDDELEKGRIIWVNGKAYDLVRPRDDNYIDRIIAEGEKSGPLVEANPAAEANPKNEQLSLFGNEVTA